MKFLFSGQANVHYGQLYVVSPGCRDVVLEDAFRNQSNGLCGVGVRGGALLMCGLHTGRVGLEVFLCESEPPIEPVWTEVVEAPFQFLSTPVTLQDWDGDDICELPIDAPGFMLRWCASHFGEAEELGLSDDCEPHENYALYVWPSASQVERVVRESSKRAEYWHQHVRNV